jgi:hypothetical protein
MNTLLSRFGRRAKTGFTLVELLVAGTITVILSGIMFSVIGQTSKILGRTTGKVEEFREARNAFEAVTTRLAQATLNAYIDYDNAVLPTKYMRRSELRFISGPASQIMGAAPSTKLRPTHAVFFQVASDETIRPKFLTEKIVPFRVRPRLMEFSQPTEGNEIYFRTNGPASLIYKGKEWYANYVSAANAPVHSVAENIVAFIVTPRLSPADEAQVKGASAATDPDTSPLAPKYLFDSAPQPLAPDTRYKDGRLNPTNQLPPMLQVTLVAVDEPGAVALGYNKSALDPLGVNTKFTNTTDYSKDLLVAGGTDSLESKLIAKHVNYRIFTTNVIIRAAKWSREQTN